MSSVPVLHVRAFRYVCDLNVQVTATSTLHRMCVSSGARRFCVFHHYPLGVWCVGEGGEGVGGRWAGGKTGWALTGKVIFKLSLLLHQSRAAKSVIQMCTHELISCAPLPTNLLPAYKGPVHVASSGNVIG